MKKIILTALLILAALSATCYDPSQNATVRINLGNIPLARNAQVSFIDRVLGIFSKDAYALSVYDTYGISKIHVAAYSGDGAAATASLDASEIEVIVGALPTSYVELDVPAGDNITILVAAEVTEYVNDVLVTYVKYFGCNTADLKAGETAEVFVQVYENIGGSTSQWFTIIGLDFSYNSITGIYTIAWNSPGFPVKYYLYDSSGNLRYQGYDRRWEMTNVEMPPSLYLGFEEFGLRTLDFTIGW